MECETDHSNARVISFCDHNTILGLGRSLGTVSGVNASCRRVADLKAVKKELTTLQVCAEETERDHRRRFDRVERQLLRVSATAEDATQEVAQLKVRHMVLWRIFVGAYVSFVAC